MCKKWSALPYSFLGQDPKKMLAISDDIDFHQPLFHDIDWEDEIYHLFETSTFKYSVQELREFAVNR